MRGNFNIHNEIRASFRGLIPRDFLILKVFFERGEANVRTVYDELKVADYSTYLRRIGILKKKGFLIHTRTEKGQRGKPQKYYTFTLKGFLAVLANDGVSIKEVMDQAKELFHQKYAPIFSVPDEFIEGWNKMFRYWLKAQANARVDLTEVKNESIAWSFVQTSWIAIPEIFTRLNHMKVSKAIDFLAKLVQRFPIFEKYSIGHCELTLRLNLPLVDFKDIQKPFGTYLYKNEWIQAKALLENTVKAKSQAKYWLRCRHFIATQNGERKCGVGDDCVYTNFLLCPKVKESLEKALKP